LSVKVSATVGVGKFTCPPLFEFEYPQATLEERALPVEGLPIATGFEFFIAS
jgi:hypothetical protein